ncbi:MAG: DUF3667 domain-containing protein [Ginsengibacter sp.]
MSHLPERKEKNCLNCGTEVLGKFCHICGQENIEPKESIWHLANHFINDVTHFDGKFFSSLKYLITRPGFLSNEYMIGRRASYLNPIRMYLFTSAIFFLAFFSGLKTDVIKIKADTNGAYINSMDSIAFSNAVNKLNKGVPISREALKEKLDSASEIHFSPSHYKTKREYDSILRLGVKKHNWFMRQLVYKDIQVNTEYKNNPQGFFKALLDKFFHTFPQMLFILLPMFALILKLLYRRKREYYYTDHLIFTFHIYIFIFIAMLPILGASRLKDLLNWGWLGFFRAALILTIFFYFYKALRNFYKQRRAKTILKYFIILFLLFFIFLILFLFFFFLSLFQI